MASCNNLRDSHGNHEPRFNSDCPDWSPCINNLMLSNTTTPSQPYTPAKHFGMIIYYTHSKSGAGPLLSTSSSGGESATSIRLEYFKEGNANIIYNIKPLDNRAHVPVALQGKLLRLRKNKPFIRCSREQHAAFKQQFAPLFHTENLVEHNLIGIDQTITVFLNANLKQLDKSGSRPVARHGDTLATDDTHGLLVTDMTAQPGEVFLELKPKWLVQSHDAPKSATRCRTCALRARRQSARLQNDASTDSTSFCPLDLVSSNIGERRRVFEAILSRHCHLSHEAGKLPMRCCYFTCVSLSILGCSFAKVEG